MGRCNGKSPWEELVGLPGRVDRPPESKQRARYGSAGHLEFLRWASAQPSVVGEGLGVFSGPETTCIVGVIVFLGIFLQFEDVQVE